MKIPYPKINRRLRETVDEVVFLLPDGDGIKLRFANDNPSPKAISKAKQLVNAFVPTVWGGK